MDKENFILWLHGGWLPQGKRTQWLGVATFVGSFSMALYHYASGDNGTTFLDLLQLLWQYAPGMVAGLALKFGGDKIDKQAQVTRAVTIAAAADVSAVPVAKG